MEDKITFNTQDCIMIRKAILKFFNGMITDEVVNAVNDKNPALSVSYDFVALIFMNMLYRANAEIEAASSIEIEGKPIFNHKAKQYLQFYRNSWEKIRINIPMNDNHFLVAYSDLDDQLSDMMDKLVIQTYYPILNDLMKLNPKVDSSLLQCLAHLLTGDLFAGMAIEHGFKNTLKYKSAVLSDMLRKIERLGCYLPHIHAYIDLAEDCLRNKVEVCEAVISNHIQPVLHQILDQAEQMDLQDYVNSIDSTWSEIFRQRSGHFRIKH